MEESKPGRSGHIHYCSKTSTGLTPEKFVVI